MWPGGQVIYWPCKALPLTNGNKSSSSKLFLNNAIEELLLVTDTDKLFHSLAVRIAKPNVRQFKRVTGTCSTLSPERKLCREDITV